MILYMDVHIPRAVTLGLRLRGVEVVTAREDGSAEFSDPDLLDRSGTLGCLLFTNDEDFLAEADRRQRHGIPFSGVVYCRQGRLTIRQLVDDLELIARCGEPVDFAGRFQYIPIRRLDPTALIFSAGTASSPPSCGAANRGRPGSGSRACRGPATGYRGSGPCQPGTGSRSPTCSGTGRTPARRPG